MKQSQFLEKLTQEAQLQARIQASPILPKSLEPVTAVVGRHTWKVLLVLSGLMALLRELIDWGLV